MGKFTFVIGGARSGKSSFAVELAKGAGERVAFIATCVAQDTEMKERIEKHKASRPRAWDTIEEPRDVGGALERLSGGYNSVIIDCLGLLVSNLMADGADDGMIKKDLKGIVERTAKMDTTVIVVSNEVGGGIVPENALARRFRDAMGAANQVMAKRADTVYVLQAGIPVKVK